MSRIFEQTGKKKRSQAIILTNLNLNSDFNELMQKNKKKTHRQKNRETKRQRNIKTKGQTVQQTNKQTNKQTDKQTNLTKIFPQED